MEVWHPQDSEARTLVDAFSTKFTFSTVCNPIETSAEATRPNLTSKMGFNVEKKSILNDFDKFMIPSRLLSKERKCSLFHRILLLKFTFLDWNCDGRNEVCSYGEKQFRRRRKANFNSSFMNLPSIKNLLKWLKKMVFQSKIARQTKFLRWKDRCKLSSM